MKMKKTAYLTLIISFMLFSLISTQLHSAGGGWTLIGWNNLGMHCMDSDYSVFSILPPYNTIMAQLINPSDLLVKNSGGITVTYQAIADPSGSINSTSMGKTNFWQFIFDLFGLSHGSNMGLAGMAMPGAGNQPQNMPFDPMQNWFIATGIPITPKDDSQIKNFYPMMRLVARDASGTILAQTDIVLPVSDEMDCRACHGSGSSSSAQPSSGWISDPDPERDYRLNILKLHDDRNIGLPTYQNALITAGYNPNGLYPNVVTNGKPILCARCHLSEALSGSGIAGIPPLTQSVHGRHAEVLDPANGMALDYSSNRSACYRCHPGAETRCLRGTMGNAVSINGNRAIQCQNCHGSMSRVGETTRTGWLNEPNCQSCHTGTAVNNNGQIRYISALDGSGQQRTAVDQTFATNANMPAQGLSLYRFSAGHGGVQCEACHGSTHAEYPSSQLNDNIQAQQLQGHVGMVAECTACHGGQLTNFTGGPHGLHPVGQSWINDHSNAVEGAGTASCQACHGLDYRGTVLSRSQNNRILNTSFGTKQFWRGFQIGCYNCHNGPGTGNANPNLPPVVTDTSGATTTGDPVLIDLTASSPSGNPVSLKVVSQPANGTATISGTKAAYYPEAGFNGSDLFTFAAWDGYTNSNLGTVLLTVSNSNIALFPTSESFPASGGSGSITVTVPAGFSWNAVSGNPEFISIISGSGGGSSGTINYSVAANNGAARSGIISIGNRTFKVSQGTSFNDVPLDYPFYDVIGKLSAHGITLGCSQNPPLFCPDDTVTREQMATFMIRAMGDASPPMPSQQRFADVPSTRFGYAFIEELAGLQVTLGCSQNPPLFCPDDLVTRDQMAALIIRALGDFNPPMPLQQRFQDVSPSQPFFPFIDEMALRQITFGCNVNPPLYCPSDTVTRGQMAAFLVRAFGF